MTYKIRPKRSATPNKIPKNLADDPQSGLVVGEIAINLTDRKLYACDTNNQIVEIPRPVTIPAIPPAQTLTKKQLASVVEVAISNGNHVLIDGATASLAGVMTKDQVAALTKATTDVTALQTSVATLRQEIGEVFTDYMDLVQGFEEFKAEVRGLIAAIPNPPPATPTLSYTMKATVNGVTKTKSVIYKDGDKIENYVSVSPLTGTGSVTSIAVAAPPAGYRFVRANLQPYYKSATSNIIGPYHGAQISGTTVTPTQAGGVPATYSGGDLYSIRVYQVYEK